jgi:hypothetical protein
VSKESINQTHFATTTQAPSLIKMRVYVGKLTSESKTAENEVITLIFNGGFRQGATVALTGQWTKSYAGEPKANYHFNGTVTKLSGDSIEIFKGEKAYYW